MKVIAEGVRGTPQRGQVPATQLGKGLDMEETEHKLSLEGLEAGQTTGRRRGPGRKSRLYKSRGRGLHSRDCR